MTSASAPFTIPCVSTERLLLREPRLSDFDSFARFNADAEMMRFLSGVIDRRTSWRLYTAMAGTWMLTGAGWWAIELRRTGEFIGTVGAFFRPDLAPIEPHSDFELGWSVFPPFWRNGYATEAARAALSHRFARHGARRAIAHVAATNVASIAVAKAIGMSLAEEAVFYGEPCLRYAIDRPTDGVEI
jgi:RimJ/RimL family protein N-acetyltransferase